MNETKVNIYCALASFAMEQGLSLALDGDRVIITIPGLQGGEA